MAGAIIRWFAWPAPQKQYLGEDFSTMKSKKIASLILAASMLVSLAACSGTGKKTGDDDKTKETTEETTTAVAPTETTVESIETTETETLVPIVTIPEDASAQDVLNAVYPFDIPLPEGTRDYRNAPSKILEETNAKDLGIIETAKAELSNPTTYLTSVVLILKVDPTSDLVKLKANDTFVLHNYEVEKDLPEYADVTYTVTAVYKEFILVIVDKNGQNDTIKSAAPFAVEQDQKAYENFIALG